MRNMLFVRLCLIMLLLAAAVLAAVGQPDAAGGEALFNRGLELFNRRDYRGARSAWKEAVAAYRRLGLERDAAVMLSNAGNASRNLGEFELAESEMGEALVILRKLNLPGDAAKTILNLGNLAADMGHFPRAANYWETALAAYRDLRMARQEANALRNLGQLTQRTGEYGKGLARLREALAIYRKLSLDEEAAGTLRLLGDLESEVGEYGKAQDLYGQASEICRARGFEKPMADTLISEGLLAARSGDFAKAAGYYEQALSIYQRLGFNAGVAVTLGHLMQMAYDSGDPDGARMLYARIQTLLGRTGAGLQDAGCGSGDLQIEDGQAKRALEIYVKDRCGPLRVGRAYLATGSPAAAREQLQLAVMIGESTRNAEHQVAGLIGLGLSEEQLGERESAAAHFQRAVEVMEDQREGLAFTGRQNFFSARIFGFRRIEAYEGLVRVMRQLGRLEDAFYWAESAKARWLLESISRSGAAVDAGIAVGLESKTRLLAEQIGIARRRLDQAFQSENSELQAKLGSDLEALRLEQRALVAQIRSESPAYASIHFPRPLRAAELEMGADEVLLAFEVSERETDWFLVRGGRVRKSGAIAISRKELTQLVQDYRRVFAEVGSTGSRATLARLNVQLGHRLFGLLLSEALRDLRPGVKVLVVPDESLCLLPFEALVEKTPGGEIQWSDRGMGPFPEGVKFAGDERLFTYWQSASSLTVLRHSPKRPVRGDVLVVVDPIFSAADERLKGGVTRIAAGSMQFRRQMIETAVQHLGWRQFQRLSSTGGFLERLRDSRVTAWAGLEANESAIKKADLDRYGRAVIFATHGFVDERTPYLRQAALVLSNPGLTGEDPATSDGFLTMTEVMSLRMPTELAAALACETGVGGEVAGEGAMHLGRAFQHAGAASVLMSLWSVEDQSTNLLGERVLAGMRNGETKAAALMAARRLLREKGYEHPYFWSGFILMGER